MVFRVKALILQANFRKKSLNFKSLASSIGNQKTKQTKLQLSIRGEIINTGAAVNEIEGFNKL